MKELVVGLGERSYPIIIERGLLARVGDDLAEKKIAKRYCIISDDNVAELYGDTLLASLKNSGIQSELLTFPAGEESKNLDTFTSLSRKLAQLKIDRKDGIIALGGGVTGDLAGFIASSYMRGIPFVQIPTTLLSQVDSSVGGKTGVDIPEGKNLVGAFYQPKAVYIDTDVLTTLEESEFLGGMAEVIKYGVIWDSSFFQSIKDNRKSILALEPSALEQIIYTCCKIKADVVAEDEQESNIRRILNYGHTIGHAIEAESAFSIIHGNGVAMGMVAVAEIARKKGVLSEDKASQIAALIEEYGLPTKIPAGLSRDNIKEYLLSDKKVVSGRVVYVIPTDIGKVIITDDVDPSLVDEVLNA